MIGFVIGLLRFGLEFGYTIPPCGSLDPDPRPDFVKNWVGGFHYLHFGTFLFFFNVLVAVVVSIMTEPIPEEKVSIFLGGALIEIILRIPTIYLIKHFPDFMLWECRIASFN